MALQYQLKQGNYHLYDLSTPPSKVTGEHRLRLMTDTVAIAFDARTGELRNMIDASVVDSVDVLISVLQLAASVTAMSVTTDALVLRKQPPTSANP